jgi:hypothetical protein
VASTVTGTEAEADAGVESTLRALASRRRRVALRCLQRHRSVVLADLAELVVERETGESVATLDPERVRDVYFSLYHSDVPALVDAGLVRYDQAGDVVETTTGTDAALVRARDAVEALVDA